MKASTRVFLVLLRLVIGWHFLFEGLEKIENSSWSSEPYLREASGPFTPVFRRMAGDPLLDRLTVGPLPVGADSARIPLHPRFPPALDIDWNAYFQRFAQHYQLDATQPVVTPEYLAIFASSPQVGLPGPLSWSALYLTVNKEFPPPNQYGLAEVRVEQQKYQTVDWLLRGVKKVRKTSPYGPAVEVEMTTPQRIQEYVDKVNKVRELQDQEMAIFGPDSNTKLRAAKNEANRARAELYSDLHERTAEMKSALHRVLTWEQKDLLPPLSEPVRPGWLAWSRLEWVDGLTRWGLTAVGVCLLLGLCTRTACVGGAGFLLLFYLAMPPLPGLPESLRVEGHYLIINKNIIEMVALLALATTSSGRWAGLDGLLQFLNPKRWRTQPVTGEMPAVRIPSAPQSHGLTVKEPSHGH